MSQWREVLKAMQNATGGWITTHDIYDELRVKNPSQRIDEIEREGHPVEREVVKINGRRAARYRLKTLRVENPAQAMGGATLDPEAGITPGRNEGMPPSPITARPAAPSDQARAPQLHFDLGLAA